MTPVARPRELLIGRNRVAGTCISREIARACGQGGEYDQSSLGDVWHETLHLPVEAASLICASRTSLGSLGAERKVGTAEFVRLSKRLVVGVGESSRGRAHLRPHVKEDRPGFRGLPSPFTRRRQDRLAPPHYPALQPIQGDETGDLL
jgi:hypothetical protein